MPNRVRKQTQEICNRILNSLGQIYDKRWDEVSEDIESLIHEMYLDNPEATGQERVKYAQKHGKTELVDTFVVAVILVNTEAIRRINEGLDKVYAVNAKDISSYISQKTKIDIASRSVDINKLISEYTRRSYNAGLDKIHISRDILREIERMLENGDGTKKISKRIQQVYSKNKTSADRITLTETTRIQSRGRWDVMREAERRGMAFEKIWRHQLYVNQPRDWHVSLDGERRQVDEAFFTKYGNYLMYPGDPSAPPEEVCNCHCFLDEVLIRW